MRNKKGVTEYAGQTVCKSEAIVSVIVHVLAFESWYSKVSVLLVPLFFI